MCYYFDDIIRFWHRDTNFSGTLLDEKLYNEKNKNILPGKNGITDNINHNFGKIRIDSHNCLSIEKIMIFTMF